MSSIDAERIERRYRSLITAMAEFVWTADADGVPTAYFGDETLLGPGGGVLSLMEWYALVHPDDRERNARVWDDSVAAGRLCECEFRMLRADGQWRNMLGRGVPVRDPSGRVEEWVGVVIDVTERRRVEDDLRQAQKMEAVGLLAGGVAHDFNNLLTAVIGCGEQLWGRLREDEAGLGLVREILAAADRGASLTRQLLAFSRKATASPRAVSLNDTVKETAGMLRRLIGENVVLAIELAPDLAPVRADPAQLAQVIMNLAVNARDAMPRGGRLTLRTRDAGEGYVCLSVADTGCGMTEEVKARIFEPFFTTKEAGKGTGLGLAVVHGVVAQAGGRVHVKSEVGVGSEFEVYLQLAAEAVMAPSALLAPAVGGRETVLVVEDEDAVRTVERIALETVGYTVLEAADGCQAEQLLEGREGGIDLLVTDVVMPGMGGRELAKRLTASRAGLRVLFCSGYANDEVMRHGVLEGEEAPFLPKPFSPSEFAHKVREVLDRKRSPEAER